MQKYALIFLISLMSAFQIQAQCTVTPVITLFPGSFATFNAFYLESTSSIYTGQATPYSWQWSINGDSSFTWAQNPISDEIIFEQGYNEVCLTIAAQNVSGDSCSSRHCNIFFGTGDKLYVTLNVADDPVDSLTKHFSCDYKGGNPGSGMNFYLDFGDGNTANPGLNTIAHTYSTAGDYNVQLNGGDGTGNSDFIMRKIYVNTGLSNMEWTFPNTTSYCDSFRLGFMTTPPFTLGISNLGLPSGSFPDYSENFNNGINFTGHLKVPGQYIIHNLMIINQDVMALDWPFFMDECGISPDTIRGYVWQDNDADALWDSTEFPAVNKRIEIGNYYTLTDSTGYYQILSPNDYYRLYVDLNAQETTTIPDYNFYTLNSYNSPPPLQGAFYNFGVADLNNTLTGTVFLDLNNNAAQNFGEPDITQGTVRAYNSVTGITYTTGLDQNGMYDFQVPSGNYSIRITYSGVENADAYPDSIVVNATGGFYSGNNFAVYSPVSGGNGKLQIWSSAARPGFPYFLNTSLWNTGMDTIFGNIVINYDPILEFVAAPAAVTADTVNHILYWNNEMVKVIQSKSKSVEFVIPVSTPLGTVISSEAAFFPLSPFTDYNATDNTDSIVQTVTGSFDPNDKHVFPAGIGATGLIRHNQRLHYRINFQNTGTDTAFTVIVQDQIDNHLNMNTFLMGSASHNYQTQITDNVITWKFSSIYLADSTINEPASHGFIEYSISPKLGFPDGTEITNEAAIYFDFNAPVLTNTTLNTLETFTGISEADADKNIRVFPVPFTDNLNIFPDFAIGMKVKISLHDIIGHEIKMVYDNVYQANSVIRVDGTKLKSGVYLLKFDTGKEIVVRKIIR